MLFTILPLSVPSARIRFSLRHPIFIISPRLLPFFIEPCNSSRVIDKYVPQSYAAVNHNYLFCGKGYSCFFFRADWRFTWLASFTLHIQKQTKNDNSSLENTNTSLNLVSLNRIDSWRNISTIWWLVLQTFLIILVSNFAPRFRRTASQKMRQ